VTITPLKRKDEMKSKKRKPQVIYCRGLIALYKALQLVSRLARYELGRVSHGSGRRL
jgi:hypothetical protein